ncbi:MAG TPA: hypothetical protein VN283_06760, partial [Thiobacillus sp.]|nr:hypothetical protein [Thiobacillus sp.]
MNPLMPRFHLILLPSILTLALPGWVEAGPKKAPVTQARPLNLSLPRDVLMPAPASGQHDETVLRNLRAPAQTGGGSNASAQPAHLPYGAGYEQRRQEMGGAGAGAG